jgi:hypothetical protein
VGAIVHKLVRVDPLVCTSMIDNLVMLPESFDKFFTNVLLLTFTRFYIRVLCRVIITLHLLDSHKAIIRYIKMFKDSQDNISSEFV